MVRQEENMPLSKVDSVQLIDEEEHFNMFCDSDIANRIIYMTETLGEQSDCCGTAFIVKRDPPEKTRGYVILDKHKIIMDAFMGILEKVGWLKKSPPVEES